jgi:hypothetical protein
VRLSKVSKHSGSDFVASLNTPFSGIGIVSHCPFFDPTNVSECTRPFKLYDLFHKFDADVDKIEAFAQQITACIIVYNDLSKVNETNSGVCTSNVGRNLNVQENHLDMISLLFHGFKTTTSGTALGTFEKMGCGLGIVTEGTTPDGYIHDEQNIPRVIWEVKHGAVATSESIRQGIAEATNIAIHHLAKGVDIDEIVVPVISSNGYLLQIGVVMLLKPCFPMSVMLTSVLDITDDGTLLQAAQMLLSIKDLVARPLNTTAAASSSSSIPRIGFCEKDYYFKNISQFFSVTGNIQTSLFHYYKIMATLHKDESCRKFVVFPLCVREYDDNIEETGLIFPMLQGFQIGLPNLPELRKSLMNQLRLALDSFHKIGVVHFDFYLSNFMWRQLDDINVELKVVDWDSAHFVWETLSPFVKSRLEGRRDKVYQAAMTVDQVSQENMKYYDISLLRVLQENIDLEGLRSSEKDILDEAFKECQTNYYKQHN